MTTTSFQKIAILLKIGIFRNIGVTILNIRHTT